MFTKILLCLLALSLVLGIPAAFAAEVDCDSTYCFCAEDFASTDEELKGICITGLPQPESGTVMLGTRVLRKGDILSADQLSAMTFHPLNTVADTTATVTYLPIYENRVEPTATMTISIRGKEDLAPVVQSDTLQTYKNLPNKGQLNATDPEGKTLTYCVVRQPKRGTVTLHADGSFVYTPKKNKVGTDSFTFTATDPSGKVSKEATVTIEILKPSAKPYTDTAGMDCRFEAEWLKNTGLFVGERIAGELCFSENKPVTRGEFLSMVVKVLDIPVDKELSFTGYADEIPQWLKPYLAAALRSGVTAGLPSSETGIFGAEEAITGGEVAVMLQNALDLGVAASSMDEMSKEEPAWAMAAVAAMNENGFSLVPAEVLTRGQAAQILYQVSCMAQEAPALAMYQ